MSAASFRLALMKAVRAERTRAGLTQEDLAGAMGWQRKTINQIEMGDRDINAHELPDLCRALGVDMQRLVIAADSADRDALGL